MYIFVRIALGLVLAAQSTSAFAQVGCVRGPLCDVTSPFSKLVEETYAASAELLLPNLPETYRLSTEQLETMQALDRLEDSIRETKCDDKKFEPKIQLEFRYVGRSAEPSISSQFNDPTAAWADASVAHFYGLYSPSNSRDGPLLAWLRTKPGQNYYADLKLKTDFLKTHSIAEIQKELQSKAPQYVSKSDIAYDATLAKILHGGASWSATIADVRANEHSLTLDHRLQLLSVMGKIFYENFDTGRQFGGPRNSGIVSTDAILEAARKRVGLEGFYEEPYAGICRDISVAHAQLTEALGFKNVFVIGHMTSDRLTGHATVYAEDPNEPGKSFRIDGENIRLTQGRSGADLLHSLSGKTDASRVYNVYDAHGSPITQVRSESELTSIEALRGSKAAQELAPGYQPRSNLAIADISWEPGSSGRAYVGQDRDGNLFAGVGRVSNYGQPGGTYEAQSGVALNTLTLGQLPSAVLFGFYDGTFRTEEGKISSNGKHTVHAYARAFLDAQAGLTFGDRVSWSAGFDHYIEGGVRYEYKNDSPISANATLAERLYGTQADNRGRSPTVSLEHMRLEANIYYDLMQTPEGRGKLAQTELGRAYLFASAVVLADQMGLRQIVKAGVSTSDGLEVEAQYQGRITADMPLFQEATVRSIAGTARKRFESGSFLEIGYQQSVEKEFNNRFLRLKGQLVIH